MASPPVGSDADDSDVPTPLHIQRKRDPSEGAMVTIDASKQKDYQRRFRAYKLDVELHESNMSRLNYWRVFDPATGAVRSCGFDVDMDRYLSALDAGTPFERIDLFKGTRFPLSDRKIDSSAPADAPLCVVCGEPGGLPCPSMVKEALDARFVLAVPLDSPAMATHHVHPGRCRKRLRAHLDAGRAARRNT